VRTLHVGTRDLVAGNRHDTLAGHRANVLARDPRENRPHLGTRHALGVLHRLSDGAGRFFDV
jgi:hypothetical protein